MNTDTSITPLFLKDPEEGLRRSFNMDRAYCSFLFKSTACDAALRLLLLGSHASVIVALVQKGLREAVDGRFSPMDTEAAAFYTQALTIGIWQDVRLVGYLSLRGLSMESSAVVRRTLEHLGVLAHFWHAPEKAKVPGEDGDSDSYKDAFVNRNARAGFRGLKGAVKPRFAGLEEGSTVSTLYGLFSEFGVHGGSAKSALDYPGDNARLSCPFVTRSVEADPAARLEVFSCAILLVCKELVALLQRFGPDSPYTICSDHNLRNLLNPNYLARELAVLKAELKIDESPTV